MYLLVLDVLLSALIVPRTWRAWRSLRRWPRVPLVEAAAPAPLVSVVVPARNEVRGIQRCLRSLLAQRYPSLRLIVLDDESQDGTGAILEELARGDSRLRVVAGGPPPDGWVGKCWALHQAVQFADPATDYFLFTDADTAHQPLAVASAVAYAQHQRLDLLSLGTGQRLVGRAERLLLPLILGLAMLENGSLDEVNDPARTEIAKANGQFILVSAAAYARIGGHAAVRAALVEDFELARRAKRLGLRVRLADGRHLVETRGYTSVREIWNAFSRNAPVEAQRQPGGSVPVLLGWPLLSLGPYVLMSIALRRRSWLLLGQSALQVAHLVGITTRFATALGLPFQYGLAQPVAATFLWLLLVAADVRRALGRPVVWKERPVLRR